MRGEEDQRKKERKRARGREKISFTVVNGGGELRLKFDDGSGGLDNGLSLGGIRHLLKISEELLDQEAVLSQVGINSLL